MEGRNPRRRLFRRGTDSLLACGLLLIAEASAQAPWSFTEIEARRAEADTSFPRRPPRRGANVSGTIYSEAYGPIAAFLARLQERPPLGLHRGGVWLGEAHVATDPNVFVQTVSTTQAIWVWSRHRERTGDRTHDPNVALAWSYVQRFPAYFEEGGSSPYGYYRVYNCAWMLLAEREYRRVTGDASQLGQARACATHLVHFPLRLTGTVNIDLNAFTEAFAMMALYRFGVEQNDPNLTAHAIRRAQELRQLVERMPFLLGREIWALSGGALFQGVVEVAFANDPQGRREWVRRFADRIDVFDGHGEWHHAHDAWNAIGQATAWRAGALLEARERHLFLVDHLLSRDGDLDGGIPVDSSHGDSADESWVSSFVAAFGLEPVDTPLDLRLEPETDLLANGTPLRFEVACVNHLPTPANTAMFLFLTPPSANPLWLGSTTRTLPARGATTTGRLEFPFPAGTPQGIWNVDALLFGRNAELAAVRGFRFRVP